MRLKPTFKYVSLSYLHLFIIVVWKFAVFLLLVSTPLSFQLYKPKSHLSRPGIYRRISLLRSLVKLFEHIHETLRIILDINNIIRDDQFGFYQYHNTTLQLLCVTEFISVDYNNHFKVWVISIDLQKASDAVWTIGLIYKFRSTR